MYCAVALVTQNHSYPDGDACGTFRAGRDDGETFGYPDVHAGVRGVKFINTVVEGDGCGWIQFVH